MIQAATDCYQLLKDFVRGVWREKVAESTTKTTTSPGTTTTLTPEQIEPLLSTWTPPIGEFFLDKRSTLWTRFFIPKNKLFKLFEITATMCQDVIITVCSKGGDSEIKSFSCFCWCLFRDEGDGFFRLILFSVDLRARQDKSVKIIGFDQFSNFQNH